MTDAEPRTVIHGTHDPKFAAVADAFEANFADRGEVGASVCVMIEGETVVDLWGGLADPQARIPWRRDTICPVFSCTKAATAICAQILVDRGELDLHKPIAEYWPEFAQNGKDRATVLMALNHSLGLPALREKVPKGVFNDWDATTALLAAEAPFWAPGTRNGYHMISFGWLVGELVRLVSGKSLGEFFADEVAEPLGVDFWIGLPKEHDRRFAPIIPFKPDPDAPKSAFVQALLGDQTSLQFLALMNTGGFDINDRATRAAEIGGAGGVANARSLAGMFAPLANDGAAGDVQLLSKDRIDAMRTASVATMEDATLLAPSRFGQGFMLSMDNRWQAPHADNSVIMGRGAFGHVGAGGSIGFADPARRMSMGYAMTRMGGGIFLNDRGQGLVDAAYRTLGATSDASGCWT
ncbi:MAG: CubicO group peptidase (beta-lactamase class C family) [Paracoccaceae bacterium]|jgi:CubicO group peptidase (beta-lactamase class C family)